jgi:hypothetical protein
MKKYCFFYKKAFSRLKMDMFSEFVINILEFCLFSFKVHFKITKLLRVMTIVGIVKVIRLCIEGFQVGSEFQKYLKLMIDCCFVNSEQGLDFLIVINYHIFHYYI